MNQKTFKFLALTAILQLSTSAFSQEIAIRNVNLIDVKSGKVVPNQTVLIKENLITTVGASSKIKPSGSSTIINGEGKYLIPGLIDGHIHFSQSGSLYTRPDALNFTQLVPYEKDRETGFQNTGDYFSRYLALGITTIVDVGGPFSNFTIRDSLSKKLTAPNVLVTGPLFSIVDRKELELNDPPIIKVATNADVDNLFNKMLPYKPDFIKIWYIADKANPAEKSFPLVKYLGDLCKKNNLKLAVHATELSTAKLAVEAGANILVHSIEDEIIPDSFIATLKAKQITYIPTMIVANNYATTFSGKLPHHPQDLRWANAFAYGTLTDPLKIDTAIWTPSLKWVRKNGVPKIYDRFDSIMRVNLKKVTDAGVNVATGTDAGNIGTFHASSYMIELEAMKKGGMTNAQILKASTINAANGFGIGNKVGSIEKGKQADLVLLSANPLDELSNLSKIEQVFRNGKVFTQDSLVKESPEAIVQRQLNAYNAHDIEAFIDTYSKDVELYTNEGKLIMKGHDEMRKSYGEYFKTTPDLYCEIENRIVINNKVIDKEKVLSAGQTFRAVAVYEVKNGKISKVTFIQ